METEVEAKFLNVDHDELRFKLQGLGAKLVQPKRLMRRVNVDYTDRRLERQQNGWLRIRDEGDQVSVAYKQVDAAGIHGMKEVQITVDDFTRARQLFESIGLEVKSYAETRRETWRVEGCEVVLDEWPWVRTFCELEGPNEAAIQALADKLGFDWQLALFGSVEPVYRAEYDITDPEFYSISDLRFGEPLPELLQARKRPQPVMPSRDEIAGMVR